MFTKLISIWTNNVGEKIKIWQTAKSGLSYEVQRKHGKSNFFGSYDKLQKTLLKDGFKEMTHEFNNEKFIDNVVVEALKPGQKVKIPDTINMKLSPAAQKALDSTGDTAKEKEKIEQELNKHKAEYAKLNHLLNAHRLKMDQLKQRSYDLEDDFSKADLKYFSLIEDVCSDFIADMKAAQKFLYRGMRSSGKVVYGKPYENRKTMDTSSVVQEKFDSLLKSAGFKALRSNSIFASASKGQAGNYGDGLYIIFPRNGYECTWSLTKHDWIPKPEEVGISETPSIYPIVQLLAFVIDCLTRIYKNGNFYKYSSSDKYLGKITNSKSIDKIIKLIETDKDIKAILANLKNAKTNIQKNKVLDLESAKIIDVNLIQYQKFFKDLDMMFMGFNDTYHKKTKIKIHKFANKKNESSSPAQEKALALSFVTKFKLKSGDMKAALKSNNEIYINGEYIAFNVDTYEVKLRRYFEFNKIIYY